MKEIVEYKYKAQKNSEVPDGFLDLVRSCYKENPDKSDLKELRKYLNNTPELYSVIFDLGQMVQDQLLKSFSFQQDVPVIAVDSQIEHMKLNMGYEVAPMLEKLLIDSVVNSWIRYQWAEYKYFLYSQGQHTMSEGEYWSKVLSAAQRRYLRACETLARVRKLARNTPALQVNIATERGQQVNIAGNLIKEESKP